MARVSQTGQPVNRPLFWDFPEDDATWEVAVVDAYMFGPDFLVAPITDMGARTKTTYLPAGAAYTHFFTNASYEGGRNVTVAAPLDEFPLFRVRRH